MTKEDTIETTRKWLLAHGWVETKQGEWMKSIRSLKSAEDATACAYCDGDMWQIVITCGEHILFNDKLGTDGPMGYGVVSVLIDRATMSVAFSESKMSRWAHGDTIMQSSTGGENNE